MTEELRRVGAQMANALYNLSQNMNLAEHVRQTAKRLSGEWDGAMRTPPPAEISVGTSIDALRRAERFMSGFEGDEMQDGIDDDLAAIRDAIASLEAANG